MAIRKEPDEKFSSCNEEQWTFSPCNQWSPYPPKMTQTLLAGLLRHIRATAVEEPPNFLQKSDPRFRELHNVINNLYRKLQGQGIDIQAKSAEGVN